MYDFYTLGNTAMSIYWLIYGILTGIMLNMAAYMIGSTQSCTASMSYPISRPLRRATGVIAGVAASELLLSLGVLALVHSFQGTGTDGILSDWVSSCVQQLFVLIFVPTLVYYLQAVLQGETKFKHGYIALAYLFPLVVLVWTIVHGLGEMPAGPHLHSILALDAIRVYWAIFIVALLFFYIKAVRRYHKRLLDVYSDITNRDVKWLYALGVFAMVYVAWFVLVYTVGMSLLVGVMVQHVMATMICFFVCYHADRQRLITWEAAPVEEAERAQDLRADNDLDARVKAWVEKKEYLNPDLTRDDLVLALQTNRTYLSNYLAQRDLTFYKFVNAHRINYAIELMKDKNNMIKLAEVAERSGFNSPEVFSRQFKAVKGCLPSQYE